MHGLAMREPYGHNTRRVVFADERHEGLDPGVGWFAVHTEPVAEFRVEEGLRKIGFQTFLPTMVRRISHGRRVVERTRALFPRYVFVGFNPDVQVWGPINTVKGVSRLLQANEKPLQIPDSLITKIMVDDLLKVNDETINRDAPDEYKRPKTKGKAHKSWKGRKERARLREARKRTKGMAEWLQRASKGQ